MLNKKINFNNLEKIIKIINKDKLEKRIFFNKLNETNIVSTKRIKIFKKLVEKKVFKNLNECISDGRLHYLAEISKHEPKEVLQILFIDNDLEKISENSGNPFLMKRIILIIIKDLKETYFTEKIILKILKFFKFLKEEHYFQYFVDGLLPKLSKLNNKDLNNCIFDIVKSEIKFHQDPNDKEKRAKRKIVKKKIAKVEEVVLASIRTKLEPNPFYSKPPYSKGDYQQILKDDILPLAELHPFKIAKILIDTVANMIKLRNHKNDDNYNDLSDIWCPQLFKDNSTSDNNLKNDKSLVQTLTSVCEKVYNKEKNYIKQLDQQLRKQPSLLFERLRHYLYAQNPKKTLEWIRKEINHYKYSKPYSYELQLMIKNACEEFGSKLLTSDEKLEIFKKIENEKRDFYRNKLFSPFSSLLNEKDIKDFKIDKDKIDKFKDEDYKSFRSAGGGFITKVSPIEFDELNNYSDHQVLDYINNWNDEQYDIDLKNKISFSKLAETFQELFIEEIIKDQERLEFWLTNRAKIKRPIYVAAIIKGITKHITTKDFSNFEQWIEFCNWVLELKVSNLPHNDWDENDTKPKENSHYPNLQSARRSVVDFITTCVDKETKLPFNKKNQESLYQLLEKICTQFDYRLDNHKQVILNDDDDYTEAINNTRSLALEVLINFGLRVKEKNKEKSITKVTDIISKRLSDETEHRLTQPEKSLLAVNIFKLDDHNKKWTKENINQIFDKETFWNSFNSFTRYNNVPISQNRFELIFPVFKKAVEKLDQLEEINEIGQYLILFYIHATPSDEIWDLIEACYKKNKKQQKFLTTLFNHFSRILIDIKEIEPDQEKRIEKLRTWFLKNINKYTEDLIFIDWLDIKCLKPQYLLEVYLKFLEKEWEKNEYHMPYLRGLHKYLKEEELLLVSKCFLEIANKIKDIENHHISLADIKPIIEKCEKSKNEEIIKNITEARKNLLRIGIYS